MDTTAMYRWIRQATVLLGVVAALSVCAPLAARAQAAVAEPAGDAIVIGDPDAIGRIELFVDPLCPFSGRMIQRQGGDIGRRIEAGTLRVDLRFVDFLDKYSASGTYDSRAIYATYVVSDQSRSSDVTWRFVQSIFSKDRQPKEKGATDLSNDELADLAGAAGAPPFALDLIRFGVPIGVDPRGIATRNNAELRTYPEPGVPLVVLDGKPLDGESDWQAKLPR